MTVRKVKDEPTTTVTVRRSKRRKPWFESITPTAAVVVVVVGFVTLALGITTCLLYAVGRIDVAKDCAIQSSAAMTALIALVSRTHPDPAATVEQPANVTAVNDDESGN